MDVRVTAAAAGTIDVGGDLTANRMGFGAMRITGPGIWGEPPDRDRAKAALRRAVELEVNFIDTADSYGPEVSERLIAETLYPYPENLIIATKGGLGRPGPGRWEPDGRPDHLRRACEGSLARLRLDPRRTAAFICGPEPMMRFSARVLLDKGMEAADIGISLERNMQCGVGLCGHCQLGPLLVCRDGPVVDYGRAAPLLAVREL